MAGVALEGEDEGVLFLCTTLLRHTQMRLVPLSIWPADMFLPLG